MKNVKCIAGIFREYLGLYLFILLVSIIVQSKIVDENISLSFNFCKEIVLPLFLSVLANVITSYLERKKLDENNNNLQEAFTQRNTRIYGLSSEIRASAEILARKAGDDETRKDFKILLTKAKNIQNLTDPKGDKDDD